MNLQKPRKYYYKGDVLEFDKIVEHNWYGETVANSEAKARSNLIFQWKKKHNRKPNTKISLAGVLDWEV